jgi:hypothetical protein
LEIVWSYSVEAIDNGIIFWMKIKTYNHLQLTPGSSHFKNIY